MHRELHQLFTKNEEGETMTSAKLYPIKQVVLETLLGDPSKAKQKLGWVPEITAQEMCAEMVAHDLAQAKQHALLKSNGYQVNVSVE